MKKKLSWDEAVQRGKIEKELIKKYKLERDFALHQLTKLRRFVSIPIVLGLLAIILYYYLFGTDNLIKALLEWTIGVTIVVTIVAYLTSKK